MSNGYIFLSGLAVLLFCLVGVASYKGWGLTSDSQALAQARARARSGSVRTDSLHRRSYYGGGPGFGK